MIHNKKKKINQLVWLLKMNEPYVFFLTGKYFNHQDEIMFKHF